MSDEYLINSLHLAHSRDEYDANVKRVLSDKQVLARILKHTTSEFRDMEISEIIPCIEPPSVAMMPVFPSRAIEGASQESAIDGEGKITYDIRFFAVAPNKEKTGIRIIIDVEAQKSPYPGYDLVTRGMFYCGRMLSEQLGKTVTKSDYDALNKVYSIWIVMNCPKKTANTISSYSIRHAPLYGQYTDTARSDLLSVVMIRLPEDGKSGNQEPSEIHKVLSVLLSQTMPVNDKLQTLENQYGFDISGDFEKEVSVMCNLGENLVEKTYEETCERNIAQLANKLREIQNLSEEDAEKTAREWLSKPIENA